MINKKLAVVLSITLAASALTAKADEGVKINALFQGWLTTDNSAAEKNNFTSRRAELKFSGSAGEKARWFIALDPTTSASATTTAARDLGAAWAMTDSLEVILGYFKTLTSAEGLAAAAKTALPEKSLVSRTFGDKRASGVQLNWKESMWKLGIMVSDYGATPQSITDFAANSVTTAKDISARFDINPMEHVTAGAFYGKAEGDVNNAMGFNAGWQDDVKSVTFEYDTAKNNASGADVTSVGWVAEGSYTWEHYTPAVRYESFKANKDVDTANKGWTFGVSRMMDKNAKLTASYGIYDNMSGGHGQYAAATSSEKTNVMTVAIQVAL